MISSESYAGNFLFLFHIQLFLFWHELNNATKSVSAGFSFFIFSNELCFQIGPQSIFQKDERTLLAYLFYEIFFGTIFIMNFGTIFVLVRYNTIFQTTEVSG